MENNDEVGGSMLPISAVLARRCDTCPGGSIQLSWSWLQYSPRWSCLSLPHCQWETQTSHWNSASTPKMTPQHHLRWLRLVTSLAVVSLHQTQLRQMALIPMHISTPTLRDIRLIHSVTLLSPLVLTDALLKGWGGVCQERPIRDRWGPQESQQMKVLEMMVV